MKTQKVQKGLEVLEIKTEDLDLLLEDRDLFLEDQDLCLEDQDQFLEDPGIKVLKGMFQVFCYILFSF